MVVTDMHGVNVVYDRAMSDMAELQTELLRLGTHYVLAARENFDTDSSNSESSGDALFYVDTAAVLQV